MATRDADAVSDVNSEDTVDSSAAHAPATRSEAAASAGPDGARDRVRILDDPQEALQARIDLIQQAERTLDVSYYSFLYGPSTEAVIALLAEAAERGVRVRLILDGVTNGLEPMYRPILAWLLARPNLEVRFFNPPGGTRHLPLNNRLHIKILMADESQLISGGRNIGDEYFGIEGGTAKHQSRDRDLYIRARPDADAVTRRVADFYQELWDAPTTVAPDAKKILDKEDGSARRLLAKAAAAGDELMERFFLIRRNPEVRFSFDTGEDWSKEAIPVDGIRFVPDPILEKSEENGVATGVYDAFAAARERVVIQSPYVIPTRRMAASFEDLRRRDVGVEILTNSVRSSPNVMALSGYTYYREKLRQRGVRFWEFGGPFNLHAKSFVVDERTSMLGSVNFDARSFVTNSEVMYLVEGRAFARRMMEVIESYREGAEEVRERRSPIRGSRGKEAMVRALSLLAPVTRRYL